jgi:hypothetical protein
MAAAARARDLVKRIAADFSRSGIVGERTNALVGYLAAISRKLERPLALLIQSTSAAGKSSLLDAVLQVRAGGGSHRVLGDDGTEPVLHGRDESEAQDAWPSPKKKARTGPATP